MESMGENQKFELNFSEKAVRSNERTVILLVILPILMSSYVGIKYGAGWIIFAMNLIVLLTAIFGIYYVRRLVRESYFTISSDNRLICVYKGRAKIEYPVKEISKIEEVTLEQVEQKHAKFPVVLNSKGEELYPSKGVLITFNRAWIKSVFPVYFNPRDIEGFILAIKQRMEET
ncbi:MAG: hypothetical protein K2H35_02965 [Muribaculaceae bacterium]|nr:hypothetical protein [Muribaculaceae bacterium]